jgi:hypothetical protein
VKIRHLLLALLAGLMIAFMQPLVTFLGGLTLLLGVGALIFRDLTPHGQEVVERRILGWLRRARAEPGQMTTSSRQMPVAPADSAPPGERPRRGRPRIAPPRPRL